jgi:hypothetical protein
MTVIPEADGVCLPVIYYFPLSSSLPASGKE